MRKSRLFFVQLSAEQNNKTATEKSYVLNHWCPIKLLMIFEHALVPCRHLPLAKFARHDIVRVNSTLFVWLNENFYLFCRQKSKQKTVVAGVCFAKKLLIRLKIRECRSYLAHLIFLTPNCTIFLRSSANATNQGIATR